VKRFHRETIIDITKLFYLANACRQLPSACLKYKVSNCNEQRVRRDVRVRAESKHMPTPFLCIVKTAVAAIMEMNAVMP